MSAILPGYEHDIFISYRHNDNLYDGWVTEFVQRLQQELSATIKDKLNIYFDRGETHGLGESHQVSASLNHRLKSLIFIPLVSQTYCDQSKFSWQDEFLPFKYLASRDTLGLNLRLPNGNQASRILPLRIHQLDDDDVQLLERELGGHLRSIDFVYHELGVNRPLRPSDDAVPGPDKLVYRNQINKVANAIKDLVTAIKAARPAIPVIAGPFQAVAALPAAPTLSGATVFVPWTAKELTGRRDELMAVCAKAGFRVLPGTDCPLDEAEFQRQTREALAAATCAVHLLGNDFGRRFEDNEDLSFPQFAYQEASQRVVADVAFRQFVWYCPSESVVLRPSQQEFISEVRNNLTERRTFSSVATTMQFVEELRGSVSAPTVMREEVEKDTDIFFVCNQMDFDEANAITDLLSQHVPCEMLTIEPDSEDEYKAITVQAIPRSRLAVVYFKHSADWALPFVKQVWRLVGGATSTTPILLLGEDDPILNKLRTFKAPKVISSVLAHHRIPEEVKRLFNQLNQE